jgi:hypothetical protein
MHGGRHEAAAWSNTLEVDTRTRKWVAAHLRSFVRGVEEELADNP